MNDEELRSQFDVLVGRLPAVVDAETLVRSRVSRIRRRRSSAAAVALVIVVGAAVAVPEILQHQAKSHRAAPAGPSPSSAVPSPLAPALASTCTTALMQYAQRYGTLQHVYGLRTSLAAADSWAPGASFLSGPAGPTVDFCLVVGNLDRLTPSLPSGVPDRMHYAVLADTGTGPQLVSAGADPSTSPLPGISPTQIQPWVGTAPSVTASSVAPPRGCSSTDLKATFRYVGVFPDGMATSGLIDVANRTATACSLDGDLDLAVLATDGSRLAGPAHGVAAPMPVHGILAPGGVLEVEVGGDVPPCAKGAAVVTPAAFRVRVGQAQVQVANHGAKATDGKSVVTGCAKTIYAGSATLP